MASLIYVNEKLSDAVITLATAPGDVRSRLSSILPKILFLPGNCLPSELEKELDWIRKDKNSGYCEKVNTTVG